MQYMCDWFLLPSNFEATLWLSQILQGMAIKYAVEHWRRSMPRGMGTLYWQINDCWPVASWSSIDYHGRWKALHYMARNFYAPVLVSGLEDAAAGTVEVHLTNDRRTAVAGRLSWIVTDAAGKRVTGGKKAVRAKALGDTLVETLALSEVLKKKTAADVLVWLDFEADDGVRSSNLVLFARPKHLKLVDPMISSTVRPLKDGSFAVTLKSKAPALWTWLELAGVDAKWSGNFMNLMPGRAETVQVIPDRTMTVAQVQKALKVKSLIDTSVTV
jgi:beta-mannosidase